MSRHDTPHDGSAVLGTIGGRSYKCTRGNCGADIGHPVNQDDHNVAVHGDLGPNRNIYRAQVRSVQVARQHGDIKPNAEGHGWLHGDW